MAVGTLDNFMTGRRSGGWIPSPGGVLLAFIFLAPLGALLGYSLRGDSAHLRHLAETLLPTYVANSALLGGLTAVGTIALGVPTAFLISRYQFVGRGMLGWAMALPLAMPAYVAAYAWFSMTAAGGPLAALPMVRGVWGAAFVFSITFYPYVFLLARQAFESQGASPIEAARSLGASPFAAFFRAAVPLARPAIVVGVALAVMEVLADYGVADFLGAPTLTVGIVRAWSSFGDPAAAARLAIILLFAAALALGVERLARRGRRFGAVGRREGAVHRTRLSGALGFGALLMCLLPLSFGLLLPTAYLAIMAIDVQPARSVWPALQGTVMLAGVSALIAAILGIAAATILRTGQAPSRAAVRIAQAGYAVPGAVGAIGILALFATLQRLSDGLFGSAAPVFAGGGLIALLYAYQARFAAAAIGPCDSALSRVSPSIDQAARSLGAGKMRVITQVYAPLALGGIATAALLVFVEVMKELPATMILRPFDLDTLAVTAHNYASDERLASAALPSLLLVLLGVPAMMLVAWLAGRVRREVVA